MALYIKAPDRIDLRIPHIDTIWAFLCQRKDINDTTTHRKLSDTVHAVRLFIPQFYQPFLKRFNIQFFRLADRHNVFLNVGQIRHLIK